MSSEDEFLTSCYFKPPLSLCSPHNSPSLSLSLAFSIIFFVFSCSTNSPFLLLLFTSFKMFPHPLSVCLPPLALYSTTLYPPWQPGANAQLTEGPRPATFHRLCVFTQKSLHTCMMSWPSADVMLSFRLRMNISSYQRYISWYNVWVDSLHGDIFTQCNIFHMFLMSSKNSLVTSIVM